MYVHQIIPLISLKIKNTAVFHLLLNRTGDKQILLESYGLIIRLISPPRLLFTHCCLFINMLPAPSIYLAFPSPSARELSRKRSIT